MNSSIKKIKILVVDDHHLLRRAFIGLLHCNETFEVIGDASNGKEALAFLEDYEVDITLLDIEMPEMNGLEALISIKKKFPQVKVVMFTTYDEIGMKNYFIEQGADAYLAKNASFEDLCDTITKVVTVSYEKDIIDITKTNVSDEFLQLALSEIEKKIVILLCESHNNRTISDTLNMSENTVKYHRKNIYSKTRTKSLSELVVYAIKQGIIIIN